MCIIVAEINKIWSHASHKLTLSLLFFRQFVGKLVPLVPPTMLRYQSIRMQTLLLQSVVIVMFRDNKEGK